MRSTDWMQVFCYIFLAPLLSANSDASDIVDHVTRFVLGPFSRDVYCAIELSLADDPEITCLHVSMQANLFRVEEDVDLDGNEKMPSTFETDSSSISSFSDSTTSSTSSEKHSEVLSEMKSSFDAKIFSSIKATTDASVESSAEFLVTNSNNYFELATSYHNMRVNYSKTIQAKEKDIEELKKTILRLKTEAIKMKASLEVCSVRKNDCKQDLSTVRRELTVAKKLVDTRKYTKGLMKRLNEFAAFQNSKNFSSFSVKFSVFEISNDKISGKILTNNELHILPELSMIVGNVREFSASNVGLLAANKDAFIGLNQLNLLNLSYNKISEIVRANFAELAELKCLDLSHNVIEILEVNSFQGLNELQKLNLGHNMLTNLRLGTFDSLLNLKVLDLSFNKLSTLKDEIFTGINVIEEFYANDNQLDVINPRIISVFDRSKLINLSGNLCIDLSFPENSTILQLVLDVADNCWKNR